MRWRLTRRGYFWNGTGWSVSPRYALVFADWASAELEANRLNAKVEVIP